MDPVVVGVADRHAVTPEQVILKWNIQGHRIVIPTAESLGQIRKNFLLSGFELSEEELLSIDNLNRNRRFGTDPGRAQEENKKVKLPD